MTVTPLFSTRLCQRCVYVVETHNQIFCTEYNEEVLDPAYVAEKCPMFKEDA